MCLWRSVNDDDCECIVSETAADLSRYPSRVTDVSPVPMNASADRSCDILKP